MGLAGHLMLPTGHNPSITPGSSREHTSATRARPLLSITHHSDTLCGFVLVAASAWNAFPPLCLDTLLNALLNSCHSMGYKYNFFFSSHSSHHILWILSLTDTLAFWSLSQIQILWCWGQGGC